MDQMNPLLDMLDSPAFLVKDGIITQANRLAVQRNIAVGQSIDDYLGANVQVYREFSGDCLYLQLQLLGLTAGATVTAAGAHQLFCLEYALLDGENEQLRCLPQIAMHLRRPLNVLFSAEEESIHDRDVRRHLFQLQRIAANMADVPRYRDRENIILEKADLYWFFSELMENIIKLMASSNVRIQYTALPHCITATVDRAVLERAVYNLVSNAVKFSPPGGIVQVRLTATATALHFTVQGQGPGIDPAVLGTIFRYYTRGPGIEDGRCGAGFGMAIVKAAADIHNGTVLIDRPADGGTRVTLSISLQCADNCELRCPIVLPGSNELAALDNALMELSDVLPQSVY